MEAPDTSQRLAVKLLPIVLIFLFALTPYANLSFMPPTSPGIRGLSLLGMSMVGLTLLLRSSTTVRFNLYIWAGIAVWCAVSIIGIWGATNPASSFVRQSEWFCGFVLFLMIGSLRQEDIQILGRRVTQSLIFAGLLYITVFVVVWNQLPNPQSHNWFGSPFPFGHIRFYGYVAMTSAIAGLLLLEYIPQNRLYKHIWRLVATSLITVLIAGVFWSGGRGAIIGLACGVVAVITTVKAPRLPLLISTLLIAVPLAYVLGDWASPNQAMLGPSITHGQEPKTVNQFSSGRIGIWEFSLNHLRNQPIFGFGANGYDSLPGKSVHTGQPHSLIVQVLTDWGIIGGLLFLVTIFWASGKRFFQAFKKKISTSQATILAIVGALLSHGMVDGTLYHQPSMSVFLLSFSIMYWQSSPAQTGISIPHLRLAICVAFFLFIAVASLHLLNIRNQLSSDIPSPQSHQAALIRFFPSDTSNAKRWIESWYQEDPETALEWTRWMRSHSERPWNYYLLEESFLRTNGESAKADEIATELDQIRPAWSWEEFNRNLEAN